MAQHPPNINWLRWAAENTAPRSAIHFEQLGETFVVTVEKVSRDE